MMFIGPFIDSLGGNQFLFNINLIIKVLGGLSSPFCTVPPLDVRWNCWKATTANISTDDREAKVCWWAWHTIVRAVEQRKLLLVAACSLPGFSIFLPKSIASKSVNDFLYSAEFSKQFLLTFFLFFFRQRQETFILNQAKSRDFRTLYLWTLPEESMRLTYPFHTLQSHPLCLGRYFRHVSIKFFSHTICSLCHWF